MCKGPCCGTPEDFEKIMDAGYGNRLMLDDWPGDEPVLKPALKGYEGGEAPYNTRTEDGCTFWKDGLCELHDKGLKPIQGKMAHHDPEIYGENISKVCDYIENSWKDGKGDKVIERWTAMNG